MHRGKPAKKILSKEQKLYSLLISIILSTTILTGSYAQESAADHQKAFFFYQKALQAFRSEDYHDSVELIRQAISYYHGDKQFYLLQALALGECGENDKALQSFRAALTMDYNFIQCRNNMGLFQMKLGKIDEAKLSFEQCIQIAPKYPDAHYHLGQILQKRGDLDGAIEEYETATRLNPNYFDAQRDLGLAIYERASSGLTDIADCEDKLQIAAKLAPKNPMIHYHLGNIYCADGKLDDAEQEFKTALALDSRLAAAHYELGRLRYFRGDPDRCLVELNLAAKVNPTYTGDKSYPAVDICQLKLSMAKAYEVKGDAKQAASYWEDVASMTKNNKDILKHISKLEKATQNGRREKTNCQSSTAQSLLIKGITQTDAGELDAAKANFEHMIADYPDCFEAWQNHGALQEASGNLQPAMTDYKKAIELAPQYDGAYYNLAYLLEKIGLPAEAGAMYQKFHEIAGKYPYDSKHIVALEQEYARQQERFHK